MKKSINCFSIISMLFFSQVAFGQWEKVYEITDNNLYGIHALSNQTVLLGGERADVYQSENGGIDFFITSLQEYGFSQSFAFEENKQIGYLGGGCYFTFDECPGNTIYKTTDAGENWELIFSAEPEFNVGVIIDIEVPEPDIVFALNDFGYLFRSTDAGTNWTRLVVDSTTLIGVNAEQIQFFNAETGIAVVKHFAQSTSSKRLYKTTDAGDTWNLIYETGGTNLPAINNLHFIDQNHGFLCTNFGKLETTTDGGNSWTPLIIADENEGLRTIYFPNAQTGYVSSYNDETKKTRLYRTDDGGANWAIDFEQDSTYISGFHFSDSNNGYLYTGNRTVYKRSGTTYVEAFSLTEKFRVYPNPITAFLFIENDLPQGEYSAQITNAIGQIQQTEKLIFGTNQISTKNWGRGFYTIQIKDKNERVVRSEKMMKF